MSLKYPVISVTGSSGAGTSTVKHTFEQIFRREGVKPATVEGDAFHKFNRKEMKEELEKRKAVGDQTFSHFSYEANLLNDLEDLFRNYGKDRSGRVRTYVHDDFGAERHGIEPGNFTDWRNIDSETDLLFYEGLHGAVVLRHGLRRLGHGLEEAHEGHGEHHARGAPDEAEEGHGEEGDDLSSAKHHCFA